MRQGRFERSWQPDGGDVWRLRWDDERVELSPEERRRLEFLRYLVKAGRVTEGPTE
jgi:hypothetical protein